MSEEEKQQILVGVIEDEMKIAYVDYAMSVIVGRALPDVKDGLKPVHRRILYAMNEMNLRYNTSFKKCARIVGEVLGKFHPHGDTAVYDSLVRMAQTFSLRYPMINGQGNFGSVDGDRPAAMRYCIKGNSLVLTEKGLIAIGELSEKENVNLKILSKDKKIHEASKWFDSGEHPTLKITTRKGYSLTGTLNHPVLALTKDESGKPKFVWKLMEKIEKGDVLVIDRSPDGFWPEKYLELDKYHPKDFKKPRILPKFLDENLALILGSLLSEGSLTSKKIEFCNTNIEWIELFKHSWEQAFPDSKLHCFEREPSSYGKKKYYRLECHSLHTIAFLDNIGLKLVKSADKTIPKTIYKSPKNVVSMFLKAYYEGDGSISSSGKMVELSCCSKSEDLISELQILLLRFGVESCKRYDKHKCIWKLYVRGHKSRFRFYENIGFLHIDKNKKLEHVLRLYNRDSSLTDRVPFISSFVRSKTKAKFVGKNNFDRYINMANNYDQVCTLLLKDSGIDHTQMFEYLLKYEYLFETVSKVEAAGIQRVYSIKVDSDCHSFISNGFISHNTEARMHRLADEMLQDIDKETVVMADNFDGSLQEPTVLPSKLPNLLLNGSTGIAVGMATNIPPHNLTELCQASVALVEKPNMEVSELMEYVSGPDFPTGGIIAGKHGIYSAYKTGRGRVKIKSKIVVEEKGDRKNLIVTEIPYMVNKANLIQEIAIAVKEKKVEGISDLRDESDRKGMRIFIELKKSATPEVVQNALLKHTKLSNTFGVILLALVDNEPKVLNLKEMLQYHIDHRVDVITKRTKYDLRKAQERAHVLEGLLTALNNVDAVVKLIRASNDVLTARTGLISKFKLTEIQSNAILDMKLQKLAALETKKVKDEHNDLIEKIKGFKKILDSELEVKKIVKEEMSGLVEKYGDARRTLIGEADDDIEIEDLIEQEDVVVTMTNTGYVKRIPLETYRAQNRGGKGIIGTTTKEEDSVERLFVANTHSYLLVFTDKGKVYWLKVYRLPDAGRTAKGTPIVNLIEIEANEKVQAVIAVKEFDDKRFLLTATKKGIVKKTNLEAYSRPRRGGIIALTMDDGDELINVKLTDGSKEVILATANGMAVRFHEKDARPIGRTSRGVRGATLRGDDEVIDMVICDDSKKLLTVTENGFGKRSPVSDYRLINRGGKGVINIKTSERNGKVVAVKSVNDDDGLMLISKNGIIIRTKASGISTIGRNTQGVRIMRMKEGDSVASVAKIIQESEEPEESED